MKIVFASPYCLLDNTSGAAISMRTLLAGVHRAGHQAIAYGATIFDSQIAAERAPKPPFDPKQRTLFTLDVDGVRHVLLPTPHWRRALMYAADEEFLAREFKTLLKQYQPDAILIWHIDAFLGIVRPLHYHFASVPFPRFSALVFF